MWNKNALKPGLLIKLNVPRDAIGCPGNCLKNKICEIRGAETSGGAGGDGSFKVSNEKITFICVPDYPRSVRLLKSA